MALECSYCTLVGVSYQPRLLKAHGAANDLTYMFVGACIPLGRHIGMLIPYHVVNRLEGIL